MDENNVIFKDSSKIYELNGRFLIVSYGSSKKYYNINYITNMEIGYMSSGVRSYDDSVYYGIITFVDSKIKIEGRKEQELVDFFSMIVNHTNKI